MGWWVGKSYPQKFNTLYGSPLTSSFPILQISMAQWFTLLYLVVILYTWVQQKNPKFKGEICLGTIYITLGRRKLIKLGRKRIKSDSLNLIIPFMLS